MGSPANLASVTYIFRAWVPGWLRRVLLRLFLEPAPDRGYEAGYQQGLADARAEMSGS